MGMEDELHAMRTEMLDIENKHQVYALNDHVSTKYAYDLRVRKIRLFVKIAIIEDNRPAEKLSFKEWLIKNFSWGYYLFPRKK